MQETLINRVAESGIITINLEEFYPKSNIEVLDLKEFLFHGLIVKEKEFRESIKNVDASLYSNKIIIINCSTDAIIPLWVYMLVSTKFHDIAKDVYFGSLEDFLTLHYYNTLNTVEWQQYQGKRIVIKGCSTKQVPASAYGFITGHLKPYAQSIMFGEPCSTVPIFKRPREI